MGTGSSGTEQLVFRSIEQEAERETFRAAREYLAIYRSRYLYLASEIEPDLTEWTEVWDRMAFAILSANTTVDLAVRAFREIRHYRGCMPPGYQWPGIVPDRVRYVNALPTGPVCLQFLRRPRESWDTYRLRIRADVWGLELTKASFAVCLLYPFQADVACLDVWMQRLLTHQVNVHPSLTWYRRLEARIRREFAWPFRMSTALTQWALWDFVRRSGPTSQQFFD